MSAVRTLKKYVPRPVRQFGRTHLRWLADPQGRQYLFKMLPRDSVGVEVGVWKGEFSKLLLRYVRPAELHLVDPWAHVGDPRYAQAWHGKAGQDEMDAMYRSVVAALGGQPGVTIHREASLTAAEHFNDDHFDWLYLDGDHTYEAASADLAAWVPKVKAGGLVMCDDYIDGLWFEGGVKRAVDEYTTANGLRLELRREQAWFRV